eukprot:4765186-Prymnesium_polylepis.1
MEGRVVLAGSAQCSSGVARTSPYSSYARSAWTSGLARPVQSADHAPRIDQPGPAGAAGLARSDQLEHRAVAAAALGPRTSPVGAA